MKRQTICTGVMLLITAAFILASCGGGGGGGGTPPTPMFTVGGTVSGLSVSGLVLRNGGGDDLAVSADGPFTFATALADGSPYAVTVKMRPATRTCLVTDGTGTISGANVTNVTVTCVSAPVKLTASDGAAYDYFGYSVSTSSDGSTVVVGAPGDDSVKGSAYVYKWTGASWVPTKLTASEGAADGQFGYSISVSADGSTVVVGAPGD